MKSFFSIAALLALSSSLVFGDLVFHVDAANDTIYATGTAEFDQVVAGGPPFPEVEWRATTGAIAGAFDSFGVLALLNVTAGSGSAFNLDGTPGSGEMDFGFNVSSGPVTLEGKGAGTTLNYSGEDAGWQILIETLATSDASSVLVTGLAGAGAGVRYTAVPEPSSTLLSGLLVLFGITRRRRN